MLNALSVRGRDLKLCFLLLAGGPAERPLMPILVRLWQGVFPAPRMLKFSKIPQFNQVAEHVRNPFWPGLSRLGRWQPQALHPKSAALSR